MKGSKKAIIKMLFFEERFPYTNRQMAIISGASLEYVKRVISGVKGTIEYDKISDLQLAKKKVIDILLTLRHYNLTVDGRAAYEYIGLMSYLDVPYNVMAYLFSYMPTSLVSTAYNYGNKGVEHYNCSAFGIPISAYETIWRKEEEDAEDEALLDLRSRKKRRRDNE